MIFNSKVEFWKWKNSEDAPEQGHYAIDEGVRFNYRIDNIGALIEARYLKKTEKNRLGVNVPIN